MTELDTLKEQAGRYRRLSKNKDFKQTMDDLDAHFALWQNVFGVLKAGQSTEYILAKEGSRAFSVKLRGLADEYEQLVENYEEQEEGADENE